MLKRSMLLLSLSGFLSAVFLSNAGCSQEHASTSETETARKADAAWIELTQSFTPPLRQDSETSFEYFMRQVEAANLRRRTLGLQFWRRFPNDPRRYEWLLQAVHLPPSYAVDVKDWAAQEASFEPNAAPIDKRARDQWRERYPQLRDAFLNAPEVSEHDKRFFLFGELQQEFLAYEDAKARGEDADASAMLDQLQAFFSRYGAPFNEVDTAYSGLARQLLDYAFNAQRRYMDWETSSALAFIDGLLTEEGRNVPPEDFHSYMVRLIQGYATSELTPQQENDFLILPIKTEIIANAGAQEGRGEKAEPFDFQRDIFDGWDSAFSGSKSYAASVISNFQEEVRARRMRAIGVQYWADHFDYSEKASWLLGHIIHPAYGPLGVRVPRYKANVVRGSHQLAINEASSIDIDDMGEAEWAAFYQKIRQEFLTHPETTQKQRGDLRAAELSGAFWKYGWAPAHARTDIAVFLDDLIAFYTEYGDIDYVSDKARKLMKGQKKFGVSQELADAFFYSFAEAEAPSLRSIAEEYEAYRRLRTAPFEFASTTMEGEPFDLSALRGDIVLVDHWVTSCSSCIASMPAIQQIYERYKDLGFRVVSVVYDSERNRKKVLRVNDQLGLTWPTLDAESQGEWFKGIYGVKAYPQYMLLNRDGTLYADTWEVMPVDLNLPGLLDEMLAAEAAERGEPYVPPTAQKSD